MSTYWRYRCLTCEKDCEYDMNHGDDRLKALAEIAWPLIRNLQSTVSDTPIGGWLVIEVMGHSNIIGFLDTHDGHQIELRSEYGDTIPLDIEEPPS